MHTTLLMAATGVPVWVWLPFLCLPGSCGAERADLFVELRTDLVPGVEFTYAQVERFDRAPANGETATGADLAVHGAFLGDDFATGVALPPFSALRKGEHVLRARLLDPAGDAVLERTTIVRLRKSRVVSILLTRDCRGVMCPGAGDPSATSCLGGRCVDPHCVENDALRCPADLCSSSDTCAQAGAPCARKECVEGVCLLFPENNACDPAQYCHPELGCRQRPATADAGVDAGVDAPADTGMDAPADTGPDAMRDGAVDGEPRTSTSDGLVAHWTLDETAGATIVNTVSPGTHDGTWTDGENDDVTEEAFAGKVGGALRFDGGDAITGTMVDTYTDVTVAAWVRSTDISGVTNIYSQNDTGIAGDWISLYFNGGAIRFGVRRNTGNWTPLEYTLPVGQELQWNHYAGVLKNEELFLYINGVAQASGAAFARSTNIAATFSIGKSDSDVVNYLRGDIDDVRVYDRALSAEELRALFGSTSGATCGACTAPASCPNVGDLCADGSLFAGFMTYGASSCEALYVTGSDQSATSVWKGTTGTDDVAVDDAEDGRVNHANRLGPLADFPVFELCESASYHGKNDWYVPARNELNLLWNHRTAINVNAAAAFVSDGTYYWSSTEYDTSSAWVQNFGDGRQFDDLKNSTNNVLRCVRRD